VLGALFGASARRGWGTDGVEKRSRDALVWSAWSTAMRFRGRF